MRGVRFWPAHAAPRRAPGSGRECAPVGSAERCSRISRVEPRDGMLVWCAQFEPGCQSGLGCAPHGDASESAPHFLSRKISRCGPREFELLCLRTFYAGFIHLTGLSNKRPGVSTGGTAEPERHRASHMPPCMPRRRRRRHFKFGAGMAGGSPPRPGAAEDGPIASNTRSFFGFASASGPPAPGLVSPGQYHTSSTVMATYSPCVYIKIIVRLGCRPSARGSHRPSDLAQPHGSGLQ